MNPFTESTLARPLDGCPSKGRGRVTVSRQGRRRSVLVLTLGLMGVAAGLTLPMTSHAIDVNTATPAQLQAVRGIGAKTAQIIIEERTRGGRYESFEDLSDRVKGIGPKKAAALLAAGLTLGAEPNARLPVTPPASTVKQRVSGQKDR